MALDRRRFLGSTATGLLAATTGVLLGTSCRSTPNWSHSSQLGRVIVGGHPWVYAATQPKYDIYPILDEIFADMSYAGLDGIELMHTALRYPDAVERIHTLLSKYALPVIGTSFEGAMWDRAQHEAVYEDARLLAPMEDTDEPQHRT